MLNPRRVLAAAVFLAFMGAAVIRADQVQMHNGDRYVGKVISLNADTLLLENEVLGAVKLPRSRVSTVTFGSALAVATNAVAQAPKTNPPAATRALTNAAPDLATALRQLNPNGAAAAQDHTALLDAAGPGATSKFNELLAGLISGRLSVSDIRAQARSVAEQARSLKADLDEDSAASLDGYLAILDRFLAETAPRSETTPSPAKPARP